MPVRFRSGESMDMYEPYGSGGVAGRMMEEEIVLCAASSYERKFYLNPEFDALPESIRQELQIMCVMYTEDVGGVLMVVFDEEGRLELEVDREEEDFLFDEIGSVLKIKQNSRRDGNCLNLWSCSFGCSILERSFRKRRGCVLCILRRSA